MRWIVLGFLVVLGCGPSPDSPSESGIGETGGSSMTTEELPPLDASCATEPTPATFEIVNVGPSNLYLQFTDYPGSGTVSLTHEGIGVTPSDCGICTCSECPSCAICASLPGTVLALGPMQSRELTWNGYDYPVLAEGEPHNACDSSCTFRCALGPGAMTASISHSDWFTTVFAPSVTRQGIVGTGMAEFQHPADTTRIELQAPATSVEPQLTGTGPEGAIDTTFVVASINPSDPNNGLEIAALYGPSEYYGNGEYLGLFAPAEVGTHPLMQGVNYRYAVHGLHGDASSARVVEGSVTIDVLTDDAVEGAFEFETQEGSFSGTFVAPLRE